MRKKKKKKKKKMLQAIFFQNEYVRLIKIRKPDFYFSILMATVVVVVVAVGYFQYLRVSLYVPV